MRFEIRQLVDEVVSAAWASLLWLKGSENGFRRWNSSGGHRVLVVATHPDDEVAGCGGTILLHRLAGDHVTVVHVTDGRRSRSLAIPPAEVAERRREEASGSVAALDVSRWEWLGLPEGEWTGGDIAGPLERIIRNVNPDIVYLPSRIDFHPEHYRVARAAAGVLNALGEHQVVVRVYQVQVPLTGALVNLVASINAVFPSVLAARACYASQRLTLSSTFRLKRYAARSRREPGRSEEFWEMSRLAYVTLHAREPHRPLPRTFRGLRHSPLTDPLAYARGRTERRRLAALVGSTAP